MLYHITKQPNAGGRRWCLYAIPSAGGAPTLIGRYATRQAAHTAARLLAGRAGAIVFN